MNLFIAVVTGQNVSNLPPILQFAHAGDRVVWLESAHAAKQAWAVGAIKVLDGRGIDSSLFSLEGDINNPLSVQQSAEKMIAQHGKAGDSLFMVLNGGQKLTPFGLALAGRGWRDKLNRPVCFLYGDDRPAELQIFTGRIGVQVQLCPYTRERMLSFAEVLTVGGATMRYWKTIWKPGDVVETERYGRIPEINRLVHYREIMRFSGEKVDQLNWPAYDDWASRSKKIFREKMNSIFQDERICMPVPSTKDMDYLLTRIVSFMRSDRFKPHKPRYQLSNAEQKILEDEGWAVPGETTGERFEKAVLRRVTRFFAHRPEYAAAIKEIVWGAQIEAAEFDVAIILLNGVILHLECKSGMATVKDMQSRQWTLQSSASRLARMYVVTPFFPELSTEQWFASHYKVWKRHREQGLPLLTFGPYKHPDPYPVPGSADGHYEQAPPVFEDALDKLMASYVG